MAKKKKIKSLNAIIQLHVYPFDLMISVGENDNQLFRKLDKYGIETDDEAVKVWKYTSDTSQGRSVMFPGNQSLIRIKKAPQTPEEYGTLAHEIFHVVTFIMDRVGMKYKTLTSCEAYAYLIGYITKEVYKKINVLY